MKRLSGLSSLVATMIAMDPMFSQRRKIVWPMDRDPVMTPEEVKKEFSPTPGDIQRNEAAIAKRERKAAKLRKQKS